MTTSVEVEPWRELPPELGTLLEPGLRAATSEILEEIAAQVPEYARPLEGSFGRGIRTGVEEALGQFVALIEDPEVGDRAGLEVYRELGRGEVRQGRTLDSLQAAYRVGARVAWRHVAAAAEQAELDPHTLSLLAESIFAYIDQLAGASVEGYAEALAEREDERFRRRRALVRLLVDDAARDPEQVQSAARAADWPLPGRVAALACREEELRMIRPRLPHDAIVAPLGDLGCVLVPDPDGPGREATLRRAAAGTSAALGPSGPLRELPSSWSLARAAQRARARGLLDGEPPVAAEEHLASLLLDNSGAIVEAIVRRRLAPLAELSAKRRTAMAETALAYVQHRGNAVAMGRALHLHPQSVRHRLRRLRALLGPALDDPDAAFELEAALRALRPGPGSPS